MNMLNVLFGVCMKTWTRWSLSLQFRALVYGNSWKRHLLLQSWKLEVDSGKINLVWGSRMRQTTELQFAFREPHSASLQWRGPGNWVFPWQHYWFMEMFNTQDCLCVSTGEIFITAGEGKCIKNNYSKTNFPGQFYVTCCCYCHRYLCFK